MVDRLRRALAAANRVPARIRGRIRDARRNREQKEMQEREARQRRNALDKRIDAKVKKQTAYVKEHGEPNEELRREIVRLRRLREAERTRRERAAAGIHHAKARIDKLYRRLRWAVLKRTKLRRRLKRALAQRSPSPDPSHGNGHEWHNLSDRAKKLLAIAVVKYGCYCTSITRGWGTGSHHEYVPTRGFDCGGSRMADFQRDLRYGRIDGFSLGDLLELIGPDNAAWANDGAPWSGTEGSALETQHDNHTHAFVYGA